LQLSKMRLHLLSNKAINQLKFNNMTSQEIYQLASETTEQQFNNLVNGFSEDEQKTFNSLVRLGDSKELALWTVIAQRYNKVEVSEMYYLAHNN